MSLCLLAGGLFSRDRLDARDVTADFLHARGFLELSGRLLETKVELLLLELAQLVAELILGLVDPLRSEDGALEFHVHRDRADPQTFVIYEMYRSKGDLERHVAQPYTQEFIAAVRPYVEGPLQQQFLRMLSDLPE